jgi:hypothetical protein
MHVPPLHAAESAFHFESRESVERGREYNRAAVEATPLIRDLIIIGVARAHHQAFAPAAMHDTDLLRRFLGFRQAKVESGRVPSMSGYDTTGTCQTQSRTVSDRIR